MISSKCIWCSFNEENWFIPMKIVDSEQGLTSETFLWYGCKNESNCQIEVSKSNLAF